MGLGSVRSPATPNQTWVRVRVKVRANKLTPIKTPILQLMQLFLGVLELIVILAVNTNLTLTLTLTIAPVTLTLPQKP